MNLEEKNLAGQEREKNILAWHFHIILKKKKLFQHFANLIKIRSTHLLPIFYLFFIGRSCAPYFLSFFWVARVLLHERPIKKR